jgi:outer membrane protein OmpA-like peptidoglycan-associated protein
MKIRNAVLLGVVLMFFGMPVFAQGGSSEVSLDYSYIRGHANKSLVDPFNLNGAGGSYVYFFNDWIGIKAEFEGYGSTTQFYSTPVGTLQTSGNLFTYMGGVEIKPTKHKFQPEGQILFGGAHTNLNANLASEEGLTGISPSNNGFAMVVGGGIDYKVSQHIGLRLGEFDYALSRLGNSVVGTNNQSSFRFQTGVFFTFGGTPKPPNAVTASCTVDPGSLMVDSNLPAMASAKGSDTYNLPLNYSWTATGGKVDGTGAQVRWDSTGVAPGTYTLTARVDDGHTANTSCSADVTINPKPVPPPPTMSCSTDRSSLMVGERATITATVNDQTGTPLTYQWQSSGGQVVGTGSSVQLDTTGLSAGDYTVTGRVANGSGGAADCSATVTVQAPPAAPQASKIGSCTFKSGSAKVDNVCKRTLDDVAVRLQNDPKATIVLVGYSDPKERKADTVAKDRGDSASEYLSKTKGIADSRSSSRTAAGAEGAGTDNYRVDIFFVPDGATY